MKPFHHGADEVFQSLSLILRLKDDQANPKHWDKLSQSQSDTFMTKRCCFFHPSLKHFGTWQRKCMKLKNNLVTLVIDTVYTVVIFGAPNIQGAFCHFSWFYDSSLHPFLQVILSLSPCNFLPVFNGAIKIKAEHLSGSIIPSQEPQHFDHVFWEKRSVYKSDCDQTE